MTEQLLAIDIETSGLDSDKHQILQVGVFGAGMEKPFEIDIFFEDSKFTYDPNALIVNGIDLSTGHGRSLVTSDCIIYDYLREYSTSDSKFIPVGWNVGSFDMAFIKKQMPLTASLFHTHRALDLNSVLFFLGATGVFVDSNLRDVKERLNDSVAKRLVQEGIGENWHTAGYDAIASWYALDYLMDTVN